MFRSAVPLTDLVRLLHARTIRHGGFTVDVWSGRPVDQGLAVCVDPSRSLHFAVGDWDDEVVCAWLGACRRTTRSNDVHVGGWHPDGGPDVVLDLVRVVSQESTAVAHRLGRDHRQRAMFDLGSGSVVLVGALG